MICGLTLTFSGVKTLLFARQQLVQFLNKLRERVVVFLNCNSLA